MKRFGFDETAWRLDTAPHPFAQSLATQDIRITTREPEDSLDGLFATMHECGHGLYEAGVDPALERTLLARGASLGLHESQSRLWENLVGRSRPFWSWFYPRLQETFPSELGSRRRGDVVPLDQRRAPGADPHRGRRGVVQPAHHPALRARAADHGRARPARAARRLERVDGALPRRRRAERRGRRAAGRALVARRVRLLPDVLARQRDQRPDLGAAARGRRRRGRSDRARGVRRDSRVAARATCTGTGGSSRPWRRSSARWAGRSTPSRTSPTCRGSSPSHDRARLRRRRGRHRIVDRGAPGAGRGRDGAVPARGARTGAERRRVADQRQGGLHGARDGGCVCGRVAGAGSRHRRDEGARARGRRLVPCRTLAERGS